MGVPAEFIFFLAHLIRVEWKSLSGNWQIPPHTHPTILLSHFLQNLKRPPSKLIGVTWTWNKPTRMSILNKCWLLQGGPFESLISSSSEPIIPPSICNSPTGQASLLILLSHLDFHLQQPFSIWSPPVFSTLGHFQKPETSLKRWWFSLHDNVQEHIPHNPKTIPYHLLSSGIISKWPTSSTGGLFWRGWHLLNILRCLFLKTILAAWPSHFPSSFSALECSKLFPSANLHQSSSSISLPYPGPIFPSPTLFPACN